ncbi:hypothetical protein BO70DRAFT_359728 [Aspergillus heteromorphus CBS 117.55]|uniref:Uncharacterized protein n=1 Tax=Aspergillus heteromorphus CBS 117.55 TaxID=1448321 RepID=A0A317WPE1_9EURO|nr:uncharacterized protein BO70DRAFT_359728 [Aspergillus heteromorphus CBS 117.55]PWY88283.1 hypothetical protein BO70DRAFT_359728 [Aspergillus heteromorphus CBS 117.55]
MLFRGLSLTGALCISSCAALALPDPQFRATAHSHQINLPATPCAFSDSSCSEALDPISHLTIDFSTENGTLTANKQSIFPATVPMQFSADRKWDTGIQAVQVAYSLDVRPLPARPGAGLGDIYYLKLRLFDLHGRPATQNSIAIGLVSDADRNLHLTVIDPNGTREYGHGNKIWQMKAWKSQLESYYETAKDAVKDAVKNCIKTGHTQHEHMHDAAPPTPKPNLQEHHHSSTQYPPAFKMRQNGQFLWTGQEGVMRIARPIILPALMGILAGGLACVMGFLLGRFVISVYLCAVARRQQRIPIIQIEDGEPVVSEKEALIQKYSDQDPDAHPSFE